MNSVRILGREYKVKKKKFKLSNNGCTFFGQTWFHTHSVYLNDRNCQAQNKETLFHEIFHIVSDLTASKLSERQVTAMSTGIYSVLKDNKKLL